MIQQLIAAIMQPFARPARGHWEQIAFRKGQDAYHNGQSLAACCYLDDSCVAAWLDGYYGRR